jgi:hypothetical protein
MALNTTIEAMTHIIREARMLSSESVFFQGIREKGPESSGDREPRDDCL